MQEIVQDSNVGCYRRLIWNCMRPIEWCYFMTSSSPTWLRTTTDFSTFCIWLNNIQETARSKRCYCKPLAGIDVYAAYQIAAVAIMLTYIGNCTSALHQISVPVIHGRGSILSGGVALRPALCTSVLWMLSSVHITGHMEACGKWRHRVVVRRLAHLLRRRPTACQRGVLRTAGAEARRVHCANWPLYW